MAGPKADKLTKERRVEAVYRLMLDGWNVEQIRTNTAEWGLSQAQQRRYMREARKRFEEGTALSRAELLAEHIAARRQMRRDAKHVRDKLAVLKDEAELLGLYPPKRHELGGKDGGPVQHEHKGQTHGDIDHLAAVLATLVGVGAVALPDATAGADATDDTLHPA